MESNIWGWGLLLFAGVFLAIFAFFISSLLYFVFQHRAGTTIYIAKTIVLGLLTVPVAILVTVVGIIYLLSILLRRVGTSCIGRSLKKLMKVTKENPAYLDEPADTHDVTIHLVHGTFEPMAPWTLPGSAMRTQIRSISSSAQIVRFAWSGGNTPRARSEAVKALAEKIVNSPSEKHYIIAHSHGGNIVREMSYAYAEIACKIKSVCLLSPPFIYRKKITRTAGRFALLSQIGFTIGVQIPIAGLLAPFGLYQWSVALPIAAGTFILDKYLSKLCADTANISEGDWGLVDFRDVNVFHAIGDEADSGLRFASALHEFCFALLSQLKSAAELARGRAHWPFRCTYCLLAIAGAATVFFTNTNQWLIIIAFAAFGVIVAHILQTLQPSKDEPAVLLFAALPIVVFSFWLSTAKAMAYGDWRLIFLPDLFISSSETPVGDHRVLKFAPEDDGIMVHSTHSHPKVILNVGEWLKSHLQSA